MTAEKEIIRILYQNSTDCSDGMIIDFNNIQKVIKLLADDKLKFAKHHVIKALKQASEKAKQIENPYAYAGNTGSEYSVDLIIDNESILNAYSLDNVR